MLKGRGVRISHNRIHRYLKSNNLANTEPRKWRRRKYVRYEKKRSNILRHTYWHETKPGQLIPKLSMSDHGSQFCNDENNNYRFRNDVEKNGTKHILARVKHPQSNGRMGDSFMHLRDY
jgi:hypothetical protein